MKKYATIDLLQVNCNLKSSDNNIKDMIKMKSKKNISSVLQKAIKNKIFQTDTAAIFIDLTFLEQRFLNLVSVFPKNTIHAVAIKANPVQGVLGKFKSLGSGFEVASLAEMMMAINTGVEPSKIVFDSPCKTRCEIEKAIELGVHINADSIMELERIDELLQGKQTKATFGIRINPQAGVGRISATSVAGSTSKFGVPINEFEEELKSCFEKYAWLSGVHVHIGSQGCSLELLVNGTKRVYDFAEGINKSSGKRKPVKIFDMGGGLPVQYHSSDEVITIENYYSELKKCAPKLFTDKYRLITEFGRYLNANCGWAVSKVEYVKRFKEKNILMIHLGADMFLRKCYNPSDWHHDMFILDNEGLLKEGSDSKKHDIAGPLCFSGDVIARDIELPIVEEGDYACICDVGAYTFGMWSRYNSRQMPKILGYRDGEIIELKKMETVKDVMKFWE